MVLHGASPLALRKGEAFPWSFYICETVPRRRMAVVHPPPSPPWGRGWRATGVLISRGAPGEGVPTRTSSTIKRRGAWCRRGCIGGPPVNAVALLPNPSFAQSRRSRWTWLSGVVPIVFVGFTVLTPSPACGPKPKLVGACGCPFGGRRPVSPRLVKAPVASHPLPPGGEGLNFKQHATFSQWAGTPIENVETPGTCVRSCEKM